MSEPIHSTLYDKIKELADLYEFPPKHKAKFIKKVYENSGGKYKNNLEKAIQHAEEIPEYFGEGLYGTISS